MSKQLTDKAREALTGAGAGKVFDLKEAAGEIWERTTALRIVRNESLRGRPERLQQGWFCRDTGQCEWRDVPTVDE